MAEYKKRFSEAPFTDEELKQFKQSIIDKLHSDKEKLKSTIEQKIEKLINE